MALHNWGAESPHIYNIHIVADNTEYSQVVPMGTFKLEIRCRTGDEVRFAYEAGRVAIPVEPYNTLRANETLWEDSIYLHNTTLYVAGTAGTIVEFRCWT